MKIAVSSYSFSKMFQDGSLNQFSAIAKAAELGFDGIEFVDILPHDGSSREDYAAKLKTEADRLGIAITSYTFAADLLNGSDSNPEKEIQRVKDELRFAQILGAPRVRHDATWGIKKDISTTTFERVLPQLADGCREIAAYAETLGIRTMVENHGTFAQESRRMEQLVTAVAHPNFALLTDMGNFLCADEDPTEAIGRLAPYAGYAHAKDFHKKSGSAPNPGQGFFRSRSGNYLRGSIIGHGVVPVQQCIGILKRAGYDGFVAIEFEGLEHPEIGLAIGLENLRRYIAEAE